MKTSGKHARVKYSPNTPLLYSETGVCTGIPIFLMFAPKHMGGSNMYPQSMF